MFEELDVEIWAGPCYIRREKCSLGGGFCCIERKEQI